VYDIDIQIMRIRRSSYRIGYYIRNNRNSIPGTRYKIVFSKLRIFEFMSVREKLYLNKYVF